MSDNGNGRKSLNPTAKWIIGILVGIIITGSGWVFALAGIVRGTDVDSLTSKIEANQKQVDIAVAKSEANAAKISDMAAALSQIQESQKWQKETLNEIKELVKQRPGN